MKTVIWTFENKRPKTYTMDRYYYLKSKAELDKLIDKLLDIDAVTTPANLTFPVMLELQDGFGPDLVRADHLKMRQELKKLQNMVDKTGRLLNNKTKKAIKPKNKGR